MKRMMELAKLMGLAAISLLFATSAQAVMIDLTTDGASGTVNGAYFYQIDPNPTGTGRIDPFLTIQANGTEEGYNTSSSNAPYDVKRIPQYTHDLLVADAGKVTMGGVEYLEFFLDINQVNAGDKKYLSMQELQLWAGTTAAPDSPDMTTFGTKFWDLDTGNEANYVQMNFDLNPGSGWGDVRILIPNLVPAGATNLYLYAAFGTPSASNDGYEEWKTVKSTTVSEPGTLLLLGSGLLGLGLMRRRRS